MISFEEFLKVKICVGTILSAKLNPKARKPAYVLALDFGKGYGTKTSSAQITEVHPDPQALVGLQVMAVMNFEPKRVAGVKSEVLVLAAVDGENRNVLMQPSLKVSDGTPVA